ncbi:hypothetical protein [Oxynema aestuarii]|uniref:hypothetical protein n=1 Tax=Oxynema aestuarii TaxID=2874213 RepID=UPI001B316574|nr:hypothetical protein [Oxynema aestuarii]
MNLKKIPAIVFGGRSLFWGRSPITKGETIMSEGHPYDKGKPEKGKAEKKCPKCHGKGRISVPDGKR